MSDYQAVYDATFARLRQVDFEGAFSRAVDFSGVQMRAQEAVYSIEAEMTRPSVLYRPTLRRDGDKWCALYGDNVEDGVSGLGDTPDAAMRAFDTAWCKSCVLAGAS